MVYFSDKINKTIKMDLKNGICVSAPGMLPEQYLILDQHSFPMLISGRSHNLEFLWTIGLEL